MASLVENLIAVLEKECKTYDKLLKVTKKKTQAIIDANIDYLSEITDDEQELVATLNHLNAQREGIMCDIANVLNKDVTSMHLSDLVKLLSMRQEESSKIAKLRDKLLASAKTLKMVNEQNGELLKNAMDMVSFEVNLLRNVKAAPQTANYNRGAVQTGAIMSNFSSGFDKKQ